MAISLIPAASAVSGTLPAANLPTGSVLQVVSATASTQVSTTSSTYTDITGLTATITPKFTTSKILVICNINGTGSGNGTGVVNTKILRGSTTIGVGGNYAGYSNPGGAQTDIGSVVMQALDSPATTSATTYKAQFRSKNGSNSVLVNLADGSPAQLADNSTNSTITLMEIAS
jgi:hypothetical protein